MDPVTGPSPPSASRRQSQDFSTVHTGQDDSPAMDSTAKTHLKVSGSLNNIQFDLPVEIVEKVNHFANEVTEMRRGFDNILMVQELQMQQIADLTHGVSRYPRKKEISIDPANSIAKRVHGLDGRPIIANKKFDYDRRTFVENKKDFDSEATFPEQCTVIDIQSLDRENTIVHIDDVVLTGANLECLTKLYCYDDDKKSISPETIDAFVEHYRHTKSVVDGNAYIERASVVSMLMLSAFYDGVDINRYKNMMHESAGHRYLRHDMLQGVEKCIKLAMDSDVHYPTWTDFNVTNWDISIRYLARKKDRTSSGLFIIKFIEYWNGEDIDEYRRKIAAILYNSPSNKIQNHVQAISEEI
ncbi:Os01g0519600 [Oryza sativa Japonica Group]|uniref:Os01g0519600 protein n=1 Tax=Oryza sativa subsp. japonica TaxID=39947 RepID=A0A0N7KD26_ORYSJ|nr:Os01g0519600 [Oryza sativa Japonica Group]